MTNLMALFRVTEILVSHVGSVRSLRKFVAGGVNLTLPRRSRGLTESGNRTFAMRVRDPWIRMVFVLPIGADCVSRCHFALFGYFLGSLFRRKHTPASIRREALSVCVVDFFKGGRPRSSGTGLYPIGSVLFFESSVLQ